MIPWPVRKITDFFTTVAVCSSIRQIDREETRELDSFANLFP